MDTDSAALTFHSRPEFKNPAIVLSFSGWNDAGAAATTAVRYCIEHLLAEKFASIDPEEFYDFSVLRPTTRLAGGEIREIDWPAYDFHYVSGVGSQRDFVFGIGSEPHLRWRTFCRNLLRLARECRADTVVTLGAYLDEVLYTRPVPVTGSTTDPQMMAELDLAQSRYEGPTGIIGVLSDACRLNGLRSVGFWASLPHYLNASPNPRGSLALLLRLSNCLGLRIDTGFLERAAAEFQTQVNEAVNKDPTLTAFIRELKKREFEQ